ncbi:hypothetical protein JKP88DRAFT_301845 [Tribonema minus]|uniref:Trafficking protein particle complex subunit 13 n=1 Tax=Tribonema minus TaxID=303371 RepID=A0A835ZFD5_9STRA|nr:hypothetical protein JKP88DRAFT_301845 [Tribonema minus]
MGPPPATPTAAASPPPPSSHSGTQPAATETQPTLRVMRLFKPRLASHLMLPGCTHAAPLHGSDDGDAALHMRLSGASASGSNGEGDFALGNCLKLPESFGNIYLGEKFTAYISVLNSVDTPLVDVDMSAKLQTPSAREDLADRRQDRGGGPPPQNPAPLLLNGQHLDMIVEHTLHELGTHTLRVAVTYRDALTPLGQEAKSLRKFYRFNVLNPINMSSTCLLVRGVPLVEVSIRNTTQMDLLLESYDFIPEVDSGYAAELIGKNAAVGANDTPASPPSSQSDVDGVSALECFDSRILLAPDETHQFVYRVTKGGELGGRLSRGTHTLGHIELSWRTTMGESGSVLSGPLVCDVQGKEGVEVILEGLSRAARLGEVAAATAVVTNVSDRSMHLQLQFRSEAMAGVYVHGRSFRNLGEVAPYQELRCPVQFLPLVGGVHQVLGCVIVDMQTAQEYPQGKLGDVFVEW